MRSLVSSSLQQKSLVSFVSLSGIRIFGTESRVAKLAKLRSIYHIYERVA